MRLHSSLFTSLEVDALARDPSPLKFHNTMPAIDYGASNAIYKLPRDPRTKLAARNTRKLLQLLYYYHRSHQRT